MRSTSTPSISRTAPVTPWLSAAWAYTLKPGGTVALWYGDMIEPVGGTESPVPTLRPRRSVSSATEFWLARQVEPLMPHGRCVLSPHDAISFLNERSPLYSR